jgi:hypothetical protein
MERNDKFTERADQTAGWETLDPMTREALGNFKASVHAWSDAMVSRPRADSAMAVRKTWRLASGWVLGCLVFASAVSGGLYQNHHQNELARVAAAREAEHQRQVVLQHAQEEEDLLAKVDSDISREVPSAMEPLASLMTDEESR